MGVNEVNQICGERIKPWKAVSNKIDVPPEAKLTGKQIELLKDVAWTLSALKRLVELDEEMREKLGEPQEPGEPLDPEKHKLTYDAWRVFDEAAKELVEKRWPGTPKDEISEKINQLSFKELLGRTFDKLKDKRSPNINDLRKLREAKERSSKVYDDIKEEVKSHPGAKDIYDLYHDKTDMTNLKFEIKRILKELDKELSKLEKESPKGEKKSPKGEKETVSLSKQVNLGEIKEDKLDTNEILKVISKKIDKINGIINKSCKKWAAYFPITETPSTPPPPPDKETILPEWIRGIEGNVMGTVKFIWSEDGNEHRYSLPLDITAAVNLSKELWLQGHYSAHMDVNTDLDAENPEYSQDFGAISMGIPITDEEGAAVVTIVPQLSVLSQRDGIEDKLGGALGAGFAFELFDGKGRVYPYVGGMLGRACDADCEIITEGLFVGGPYAGAGFSYNLEEAKLEFDVQGSVNFLFREGAFTHQEGGTARVAWRPISLLADVPVADFFVVGAAVNGAYTNNSSIDAGYVNFGPFLGIRIGGDLLPPQTVRQGGF